MRDSAPARVVSRPPVLIGLCLVVASVSIDLTWLLVPWTAAPPSVLDPAAGLSAQTVDRAEDLGSALRLPALLSQATGVLVIAGVVLSPPGRRLLARLRRAPGGPVLTVPLQVLVVLVLVAAARWPFGVWSESVRRAEGLSVRSWAGFTRDRLVGIGIEALLLMVAVLVIVLLARWLPTWWPVVAAAAGAALVVLGSTLYPVLIEPRFATLTSLQDGDLRTQIEELSARAGAPVGEVLVADTSTRATTLNAYVSGVGPTRRVVLQDTLLRAMPEDELLSIIAHETAHVTGNDVARGTALGALGTASIVLLLGTATVGRRRRMPGVEVSRGLGDASAAGLIVLVLTVVQVGATPVQALISRQVERTADATAIQLTGDPEAFVRAQQTLLQTNRGDPSPPQWEQWWFGSHPTGAERVASAQDADLG